MEDRRLHETITALCVNLCEVTSPHATPQDIESLLAATCHEAGFPYCERLYVGSYFCENYFLGLDDAFHDAIRSVCKRYDLRATLVVPIIGQAYLDRAWPRIEDLLARYCDVYDEVVVNDVACYADVASLLSTAATPSHIRIGVGRLFSKEMRDARYAELANRTSTPSLSAEAVACLDIHEQRELGMPALVEVDPTSAIVNVSSLVGEAPGEVEASIHLPFCFATTGRNCGPASIDEPVSRKFQLGHGCSRHCLRMAQGYLVDEGVHYVKHGRTYYFENPSCQIAGTRAWRIVYAAAHETMRP